MAVDERAERFLKACRGEPVDRTPIWIMRQAGRYLPEYRELRLRHAFMDVARDPSLIADVTLMPLRRFDLDAAILFSDITVPLAGIGIDFTIEENQGPVIQEPIRTAEQVERLRPFEPERDLPWVLEGIRRTRDRLEGRVPLIGFAGAPFTLASYVVEGRGKKDFRATKELMYSQPAVWHALMDRLAETVARFLRSQAEAGAQALQMFDSWVGQLSPEDYDSFVAPHSARVFRELQGAGVPLIHFGTDSAMLLESMARAGGDLIGVDWRIPLDQAWSRIGPGRGIQGNLDPCVLFASPELIREKAHAILRRAGGRPGHVFNLGHGILPGTPIESVTALIEAVHEFRADTQPGWL
jgi:uroporphyrinogen decarboxylase